MSANTPPDPYFNNINFNPSFFRVVLDYLTIPMANARYLLLNGLNYMTGNLGIKKIANIELDVFGRACIDTNLGSTPAIGQYGGNATRLTLGKGSESDYPRALGCDATDLWLGTSLTGSISFYTGNGLRMSIAPAQITLSSLMTFQMINGVLNLGSASGNTPIYLTLAGTSALGVANSIGGLSASSAIGDTVLKAQASKKLHIQSGAGNAAITILDSRNVGMGTTVPYNILDVYGLNAKMAIRSTHENETATLYYGTSHLSSNVYKTAIIAEGIADNSRAKLHFCLNDDANNTTNASITDAKITILRDGKVGIGTNNPKTLLYIKGPSISLEGLGGGGSTAMFNLSTYDPGNNLPNCSLVATDTGDFGATFEIKQKTPGSISAAQFTSLSINKTGFATFTDSAIIGNNDASPNIRIGSDGGNNIAISKPTAGTFSSSAAIGDMVIRSTQKLILQSGTGFCAMCINTNNYVQIGYGYTTGTYPITLRTTEQVQQSMPGTYAYANVAIFSANLTGPVAPYIGIGILNTTTFSVGFYIYSDKRLKKDIKPIENSLDLIEKINLVSFKFIDHIEKGTINNYGVIAQEIEEIIPEVINKHKDYIPNIYKNVDYDGDDRIYIKTTDLLAGDKIKIYDSKNKEHLKEVLEIDDDYITIDSPIENYELGSPLFLYGKEIPDVKNVNYEALFVINMKATQEIYKRLQKLEKYLNIVY